MAFRIPREYQKVAWPFLTRFGIGQTPSYAIKPAVFLPAYFLDQVREGDPVVMAPGTWVGLLNPRAHTTVNSTFFTKDDKGVEPLLVPACPNAYKVTYGANDVGVTPDLDVNRTTLVATAGDTTADIGAAVKPLGITAKPFYAGWISERYTNYEPDAIAFWVAKDLVIRIPAVTAAEAALESGDLVQLVDDATPKWDPLGTGVAGRVEKYAAAALDYVVGRCIRKVPIGKQAAISAGELLSTAIGVAAPRTLFNFDPTYVNNNIEQNYGGVQGKVEGVPGLALGGTSATLGRPQEMMFAKADADGMFWAVDIAVRV